MAPPSQLIQYPQLLSILLLAAAAASDSAAGGDEQAGRPQQGMGRPGCRDKCGGMSIPFPFGMDKPGCFLPGFQVTCNASSNPPRAFLAYNHDNNPPCEAIYQSTFGTETGTYPEFRRQAAELFSISLETSEVRVYGGVSSRCFTNYTAGLEAHRYMELDREGPFLLSSTRDDLVGVGWNVEPSMSYQVRTSPGPLSCTSYLQFLFTASDGSCSGLGCCQIPLPPQRPNLPVIETGVNFKSDTNILWETNPCFYGMVVERSWYNFTTEDLYGYEVLSKKLSRGFPLVLDFAITNGSCEQGGCLSGNSSCANADHRAVGYVCKCWEHYHGNPYITNGCQDIDDCQLREESPEFRDLYPCDGICTNIPGGYDCRCKRGMKGDAKKGNCAEIFPLSAKIIVGRRLSTLHAAGESAQRIGHRGASCTGSPSGSDSMRPAP